MKKTFLIDTENIGKKWLELLESADFDTHIYVFYTENSNTLFGLSELTVLSKTKAIVDIIKCDVSGKNSLDFQLSTYLGYLIAKDNNTSYLIVSNDKGYQSVIDFWKKKYKYLDIEPLLSSEI